MTITSSAAARGTITNASNGGIYQSYGTLTLSNVNVTNNKISGTYGAGITNSPYATRTILSNVSITGNKSEYSGDTYPGGFMTYAPFTFKDQVVITGNSNNKAIGRDFYLAESSTQSSVSGLTDGSKETLNK